MQLQGMSDGFMSKKAGYSILGGRLVQASTRLPLVASYDYAGRCASASASMHARLATVTMTVDVHVCEQNIATNTVPQVLRREFVVIPPPNQASVTWSAMKSIVRTRPRRKSRPSKPSTVVLGGSVWQRTGKLACARPECCNPGDLDARNKFDAAACCNLNLLCRERRFVTDRDKWSGVDQRPCYPGVQRQTQNGNAGRLPRLRR